MRISVTTRGINNFKILMGEVFHLTVVSEISGIFGILFKAGFSISSTGHLLSTKDMTLVSK